MADLIFEVDYSDLQKAEQAVEKLGRASVDQAKRMEQGYRQLVSWQTKFAAELGKANAAIENQHRQQTLANKSARDSARVFEEAARAADKHEATLERLRMKFVQGHAAMDIYSKELNDLAVARQNDIITAEQQRAAIDQLNKELADGTIVQRGYSNGLNKSARGIGQMSTLTQQAGYQIGDFIVQVQSGTNWMVAFGQQATQIAGTLTLLNRTFMGVSFLAIGTALSVIIPLVTAFGAAWMRASKANDEASNSVKTLESELQSLNKTLEDWARVKKAVEMGLTVEELIGGQGLDAARKALSEARVGLIEGQEEMLKSLEAQGFAGIQAIKNMFGTATEETKTYLAALQVVLDLERKIAEDRKNYFSEELQSLQDRITLRRLEITFGKDSDRARSEALEQRIDAMKREYNRMVETGKVTAEMAEKLKESAEQAMRLEGVDIESGVARAAQAARTLAANLNISLAAAMAMQSMTADEDAVMSQPVVSGNIFSRFGEEDLKRFGFSEEVLKRFGVIKDGGGSSGSGATKAQEDYLAKLQQEADRKLELIGLSEEEARIKEITYQLIDKGLPIEQNRINAIVATEEAVRKAAEAEKQREQMLQTVESNVATFIDSLVDGTKSIEDAFKSMLRNILMEVWKQTVTKPISEGVGSFIRDLFFANGGAFQGGSQIKAYANGGVVGGPTMFPMSGGRTGLMGEAGPEAIMPLKRGRNGKLGVQMEGSGPSNVVVNNHFHIAANGDESVRRIVAAEAPRIANLTQKQIMDQRRRGGNMKTTFG